MKLNGDVISLESRQEINDVQAMIKCYKKHLTATSASPASVTVEELDNLLHQLDVLYLEW